LSGECGSTRAMVNAETTVRWVLPTWWSDEARDDRLAPDSAYEGRANATIRGDRRSMRRDMAHRGHRCHRRRRVQDLSKLWRRFRVGFQLCDR
jgi:hypothetical protein